jgi:hypothetical protein
MNPAAANDPDLLESRAHKTGYDHLKKLASSFTVGPEGKVRRTGRKTMMEEGSLHTAMAVKGLAKMPDHVGSVYRGAAFTEEDFNTKYTVGKKETTKNLTSTSKDMTTAASWAKGTPEGDTEGRTVSVIFVTEDSGGKVLGSLSSQQGESEVLIPPGVENVVVDIIELSDQNFYDPAIAYWMKKVQDDKRVARKWFVVKLERAKAHAPWQKKEGPTADTIMGAKSRFNSTGIGSRGTGSASQPGNDVS